MTELTDRYLFAATRSLPAAQREELSHDLAERIADTIDARVDSGASTPETAEHDALVELGNPAVLAASYSDRPLMLIGPRYFLVWKRLLVFLESFVPATVAAAAALGLVISGGGWEVIGAAIGIGLSVAVHVAFWVTLVFALIERYDTGAVGSTDELLGWTPDQLPQLPEARRPHRRSDLIASLVWLAIAAAFIVWQQFGIVWIGGERSSVPLLDPALWSFWLPYLLVLIALEAAFAVWIYRSDWNWTNAIVNVALSAAFAIPVIWLFVEGMLLSAEFVAMVEPHLDADAVRALSVLFIGGVAAICAWDSIDGIVKAARGGGRGTLDFPGNRSPRPAGR
ncbi:permease prefix domain 1-containing protein [Agromyces italicus]|uniref:permease prefix domain 1-containing protein n=1 Tax=Agromyces italicus TaxID=279572 RepID=UPI000684E0EA|nr:permease prefix domain 1-containing protein [Agromyces italicus]